MDSQRSEGIFDLIETMKNVKLTNHICVNEYLKIAIGSAQDGWHVVGAVHGVEYDFMFSDYG
jgi:hypothetical protein